ncbi:sce7725 family protein [Pseudomonas alkylphenolica]|uniref:sce7725 family protein n=1 Tax=Pseudomonas alkylphenolica TaxID=237609 RepID=UPI0033908706
MYYPIIKAKRHELNAVAALSSRLLFSKFRPVIEPVNSSLSDLTKAIDVLAGNSNIPLVVINPAQGDFKSSSSVGLFSTLQSNPLSKGKFLPCVKVKDSSDVAALNLLASMPYAAVYLESDLSLASVPVVAGRPCVLVNEQKIDPAVLTSLGSVVIYADSFAKKKRNADYGASSFYSSSHVSYRSKPNVVGFGDFTIVEEEFSGNGGPAYVVAIHVSHIDLSSPYSMYVRHFCSTTGTTNTANLAGKYMEALRDFVLFDSANPGFFYRTEGVLEFHGYYSAGHFPGLGVVKEMSIKHHIETICNYI